MCGRTACALAPDDICRACGYKSKRGNWTQPRWQDPPGAQKYYTSYNVCPTSHTPILLPKTHFPPMKTTPTENGETGELVESPAEAECDWVLQPMHWGLVPSWTQGDNKSSGYLMNNARSESMLSKRSFKVPLEKGRRCVVIADGYFEWQTDATGKKQPYFLYFPHAASENVEQLNKDLTETEEGTRVFTGRRLLTLAGVYDVWHPKNGDPPLYSYAIITVASHKSLSWLHERMPAVLDGEKEVRAWLDSADVPLSEAVKLIRPTSSLHYHPVSSVVGNVKNKSEDCVRPVDLEEEKKKKASESGSSNVMMSWLKKGKKRKSEELDLSQGSTSTPSELSSMEPDHQSECGPGEGDDISESNSEPAGKKLRKDREKDEQKDD